MRRNKYGAKKTEIDGIVFDSKKEATRYEELLLLEKAGAIEELTLQKSFLLQEGFVEKKPKDIGSKLIRPITYVCDFYYYDKGKGWYVVEDVKGIKTEVYKIKKKMFLKQFGDTFEFVEI
ncbi:MAG: DUF1064 domain-containing protein [Endomicrobium sp.]|jgi:hypothetical protein|nr:DUF1064 domain-containing protein [Endomicrobium sp.]